MSLFPLKRRRAPKLKPNKIRWQSDVIVDLMREYGFPYASLNPGASYRGLHDSMVNYGQDYPQMILCPHENIAVQIAHGYAKTTGEPGLCIVHNLVGMLHACMAIYYAYIDKAPIFVVGAGGPMDTSIRRPRTDWNHIALVQGNALRDYTKWDDQPYGIKSVPGSFARCYEVMMTEPTGPIYLCFDAQMLEAPMGDIKVDMPPSKAAKVPTRIAADPAALQEVAEILLAAKNPVILTDRSGRAPHGYTNLVNLAETLQIPVISGGARLNFPNKHPLEVSGAKAEVLKNADVVLCLDALDWERLSTTLVSMTRTITSLAPKNAKWINIGFHDLELSSWSTDYQRLLHADISILADTSLAMPELTRIAKKMIAAKPAVKKVIEARGKRIAKIHNDAWAKGQKRMKENWDASPLSTARLAHEIWQCIKNEDWVLASTDMHGWPHKIWDFNEPYRWPGQGLGTSTQVGISLGVALAHKGTGRLVVQIQPDGDLMFDPGALWVAAKYEIPILFVMFNNRAYYNDWEHQIRLAKQRGTPVERAYIGMDIAEPFVDFATLARSMGVHGEGPFENADGVQAAIKRAIKVVKSGKPALVDTVTQFR
jgi:acetolactate synthase-1/2/3 large subunit